MTGLPKLILAARQGVDEGDNRREDECKVTRRQMVVFCEQLLVLLRLIFYYHDGREVIAGLGSGLHE
jgi:hypothetical protein